MFLWTLSLLPFITPFALILLKGSLNYHHCAQSHCACQKDGKTVHQNVALTPRHRAGLHFPASLVVREGRVMGHVTSLPGELWATEIHFQIGLIIPSPLIFCSLFPFTSSLKRTLEIVRLENP